MNIENIRIEIEKKFEDINNLRDLNLIKVDYMGKKGVITNLYKNMKDLSKDEKKQLGKDLNVLKDCFDSLYKNNLVILEEEEMNRKLEDERIDISLPSNFVNSGNLHPLTKVIFEIEELFISMGYDVVSGPEVELDLYNFEKLNLPIGHPARDSQDSFYINSERLLRTQTSPVQARTMEKSKGPIRILCPGKVYRRDSDDATHSHQFTQIEGLVIDKDINMSHLKGTLEVFAKKMFGDKREIRFRPSFFPFTEPSLEVDISCFKCQGKGCNICKGTGWIEILGSGMVHPNVLRMSGYDPSLYTGFAFGMGPERIAMLKYGINDIREFYTNDIRFLKQFDRMEGNNESK